MRRTPTLILFLLVSAFSLGQQAVVWQKAFNPSGPLSTGGGSVATDEKGNSYQLLSAVGISGFNKLDSNGNVLYHEICQLQKGSIGDLVYNPAAGLIAWGTYSDTGGVLCRFDPATGKTLWQAQTGGSTYFMGFDAAGNTFTQERRDDQQVAVFKRSVADGSVIWQSVTPIWANAGAPDAQGNLYLCQGSQLLKLTSADGGIAWTYDYGPLTPFSISSDLSGNPVIVVSDSTGQGPAVHLAKHDSVSGSQLFIGPSMAVGPYTILNLIRDQTGNFYGWGATLDQFYNYAELIVRFSANDGSIPWSYSGPEVGWIYAGIDFSNNLRIGMSSPFGDSDEVQGFTPTGKLLDDVQVVSSATVFGFDTFGNTFISGTQANSLASNLSKLDSAGNQLWTDNYIFNAPQFSAATDLAIDGAGNCFAFGVLGYTSCLVKYDSLGRESWQGLGQLNNSSVACGPDGNPVVLGTDLANTAKLVKRSGSDGHIIWSKTTEVVAATPSVVFTDHQGDIYAQLESFTLAKCRGSDGSRIWTIFAGNPTLGPQGDVFAVVNDGLNEHLARINSQTGAIRWQTAPMSLAVFVPQPISFDHSGNVFVAFQDFNSIGDPWLVRKISGLNGATIWTVHVLPTSAQFMPMQCDANGDVVLGGQATTKIRGTDGSLVWTRANPVGVGFLQLDSSGNAYIGVDDPINNGFTLSKLRAADGVPVWSDPTTGDVNDKLMAMRVTPGGRVYAVSNAIHDNGLTSMVTMALEDPPTLVSLTVSPNPVNGGSPSTGVVRLNRATGADTTIKLSSDASCASVPTSIVVPKGAPMASFLITTTNVLADTTATIKATLSAVTQTTTLTVKHVSLLSGFTVTPSTVVGGNTVTGKVTLNLPAPAGGYSLAVASGSSVIQVPSSVTVPQGATSVTFAINTKAVSQTVVRTVSASAEGVTKLVSITIAP